MLIGALLAPGKRTVSAVLEVMGLGAEPQFQTYHRLLNRCVWSPMAGSQRLLGLLVATFAPTGWIVLGLDDTITKNSKDFANPDIENELTTHHCQFLTKFADGLGYIRSQL